jgi:hypothetical protein
VKWRVKYHTTISMVKFTEKGFTNGGFLYLKEVFGCRRVVMDIGSLPNLNGCGLRGAVLKVKDLDFLEAAYWMMWDGMRTILEEALMLLV